MKRSRFWILLSVALIGLAAWLMHTRAPASPRRKEDPDAFPRHLRSKESTRLAKRQVVMPAPPNTGDEGAAPRARDRLLAALPPRGKTKRAIVFEAGTILTLPVGQMFLRCLRKNGRQEKLERDVGIDPESIDRVATSDDVQVLEGRFAGLALGDRYADHEPRALGEHAVVYERPDSPGGDLVARYDDKYLLFGKDKSALEAAIARMDGGETAPPAIPDYASYGDVYGIASVDLIADILGRTQPDIADRLREVANGIELHVDATSDVLLVADVGGGDGDAVADLGKSLGAAFSVARLGATTDGDDRLATLLEAARIKPQNGSFSIEAALPLDTIERELGPCAANDGGP